MVALNSEIPDVSEFPLKVLFRVFSVFRGDLLLHDPVSVVCASTTPSALRHEQRRLRLVRLDADHFIKPETQFFQQVD